MINDLNSIHWLKSFPLDRGLTLKGSVLKTRARDVLALCEVKPPQIHCWRFETFETRFKRFLRSCHTRKLWTKYAFSTWLPEIRPRPVQVHCVGNNLTKSFWNTLPSPWNLRSTAKDGPGLSWIAFGIRMANGVLVLCTESSEKGAVAALITSAHGGKTDWTQGQT